MAIKEAHIVLARCPQCNRHLYGIRVEKQPDHWALTWAFPIDESKAKSEGYDETVLNGTFHPSPNYNGCPFCGIGKYGARQQNQDYLLPWVILCNVCLVRIIRGNKSTKQHVAKRRQYVRKEESDYEVQQMQ